MCVCVCVCINIYKRAQRTKRRLQQLRPMLPETKYKL